MLDQGASGKLAGGKPRRVITLKMVRAKVGKPNVAYPGFHALGTKAVALQSGRPDSSRGIVLEPLVEVLSESALGWLYVKPAVRFPQEFAESLFSGPSGAGHGNPLALPLT